MRRQCGRRQCGGHSCHLCTACTLRLAALWLFPAAFRHHSVSPQYLDRQDFLKRAELREYEIQRDARLASDVRTRGRL